MRWYEGNIAEAVQKAKQDGAVFGVAILGDDENSKELEATLNADEVHSTVCMWKFVFIRITGGSEAHQQFAQIYQNAAAPSVYLIGEKGNPLEIIGGSLSSYEMKEKLNTVWEKHCAALAANKAATATPQPSAAGDSSTGMSDAATKAALTQANEAVRVAENSANESNISLEEKIERAQRLAAAKRQQKLAEEAEEKKRKERERREAGKGMSELKRWQTEQEAKQLIEDRKKEKKEEADLRKKLKEQIAADRAARNARTNVSFLTEGPHAPPVQGDEQPAPTTTPKAAETPTVPRDYSGQARLQFRLPNGASISHVFEPVVTLQDIHTFLVNNSHVPYRQFTLSIPYPRKQFTSTEYSSTLQDLELVPSAALLVLPVGGTTSAGGGISSWINLILKYLLIPFTFIYNLFQRAILPPPSGPRPSAPPPASAATSSTGANKTPQQNANAATAAAELRRRNTAKSSETKKSTEGNVHRLRDTEDSDEEKATWNGNSTQQM